MKNNKSKQIKVMMTSEKESNKVLRKPKKNRNEDKSKKNPH